MKKYVITILILLFVTNNSRGQASSQFITVNKETVDTILIYDPYSVNDKTLRGIASSDCKSLFDTSKEYYTALPYFMSQYLYIEKNVYYPTDAKRKDIHGLVIVQFKIDTAGNVLHPSIFKSLYPSIDVEVLQLISNTPSKKVPIFLKNCFYRTIIKF